MLFRSNEHTVTIVGLDEVDPARGHVSWISPIAAALIKHSAGDTVPLRTPAGVRQIEILDVRYEALSEALSEAPIETPSEALNEVPR